MAGATEKLAKAAAAKAPVEATAPTAIKTAKAKATSAPAAVEAAEAKGPTNKEQAQALYAQGVSRKDIAEQLGLSYAAVYAHTKDAERPEGAPSARARAFIDDGSGNRVSRADSMRADYTAGMSVGDIGRKYDVAYQIAYQATKSLRPVVEETAE